MRDLGFEAVLSLCLAIIVVLAVVSVQSLAEVKPAEVRSKDPRPPVLHYQPPTAVKIESVGYSIYRIYIDGHMYYTLTDFMIHSEGCTNGVHGR